MVGLDAEYEIDRILNSIRQFDNEVTGAVNASTDLIQEMPEHKALREKMKAAFARAKTFPQGSQDRELAMNYARSLQAYAADDFAQRAKVYRIIGWKRTVWDPWTKDLGNLQMEKVLKENLSRSDERTKAIVISSMREAFTQIKNSAPPY